MGALHNLRELGIQPNTEVQHAAIHFNLQDRGGSVPLVGGQGWGGVVGWGAGGGCQGWGCGVPGWGRAGKPGAGLG